MTAKLHEATPIKTVKLFQPSITELEINAVSEVLRSGWLGLGAAVAEFEKKFAAKFDLPDYCVALNSCTAALEMAVELLGIGPGDEVLVPANTFVSTANAVARFGATPVFCDSDQNGLLDIEDAKRKITEKTKAIIPVHFGGILVDIAELKKLGFPIIEDCAHACGTKNAGKYGDIACFSFQAVKNLAAGDGGMLVLNNKPYYEKARQLRWCGIDKDTWERSAGTQSTSLNYSWQYDINLIGTKTHMNNINAALALVQLSRIDEMNATRRRCAGLYDKFLTGIYGLSLPQIQEEVSWHLYIVRCTLKEKSRDQLRKYLLERGVETGVHYKPLHTHNCYRKNATSLPSVESRFTEILTLPMHACLEDHDVEYVSNAIIDFFKSR